MNNNNTLPLKEAANILRIHPETLRKKIHKLEIPHERHCSNRIYVSVSVAREYLVTTQYANQLDRNYEDEPF